MALIKCDECGREISDRAAACPNCGAPMSGPQQHPPPGIEAPDWRKPNGGASRTKKGCIGCLGLFALFLVLVAVSDWYSETQSAEVSDRVADREAIVPMAIPEGLHEYADGAVTRTRNAAVVQFPSAAVSADEARFARTIGIYLVEIYGGGFLERVDGEAERVEELSALRYRLRDGRAVYVMPVREPDGRFNGAMVWSGGRDELIASIDAATKD